MADIDVEITDRVLEKPSSDFWLFSALSALSLFSIIYICRDSLFLMVQYWERDEYSHGYMIPMIAIFLALQTLPTLSKRSRKGSWLGVVVTLFGVVFWAMGELSSLYIITQYAFLLSIAGLVITIFGWRGMWVLIIPIAYLVFMIPLPNFLYNSLSQSLQLISSEIGVFFIRIFNISVFLEGNVIDLGVYKLQVVEACSGLRYLFPLMSFGFLIAAIYRGPLWHKFIIFLTTIPITVIMNSFRIGIIGVTVEYWGIEMAEGFLHDFEGWVIFIACLFILFIEIIILGVISGYKSPVIDRFDLDLPDWPNIKFRDTFFSFKNQAPLVIVTVLLLASLSAENVVTGREDIQPQRESFVSFPVFKGDWYGRTTSLQDDVLDVLKLTDYITATYSRGVSNESPVALYVAYYNSQRKGASIHSPKSCLPGGGWVMQEFGQHEVVGVPSMNGMMVNRSVISQGGKKQLVYYWFEQRGRKLTNEYSLKIYLMIDAIRINRTDGALVRVITMLGENEEISTADERLGEFLLDFYPKLESHIPSS